MKKIFFIGLPLLMLSIFLVKSSAVANDSFINKNDIVSLAFDEPFPGVPNKAWLGRSLSSVLKDFKIKKVIFIRYFLVQAPMSYIVESLWKSDKKLYAKPNVKVSGSDYPIEFIVISQNDEFLLFREDQGWGYLCSTGGYAYY